MKFSEFIRTRLKLGKLTEASATARDPKKIAVKKLGQAVKGGGGGDFEDSPVDLGEVGRAYYTDSYIRKSVDKYASLMFKNGWELQSKNPKASEYVWTRLKLMAEATQTSVDEMLTSLANDYVLYGNAYLVKARQKGSTAVPGINAIGYTGKQPIAGYFVLPPTQIQVGRDDQGKLLKYQQTSGGGQGIEFKPEDIVHFTYRRPTGRAYGVPFIFNAMDDVKILRQIEENVARLIHRNLFPLYTYQVGLPQLGMEATDEEIEDIREQIRDMPMDGGIVVPERHNIKVVGAEGNAIDANGYLKYFRQRVFTGLGVSDSVMGVGDTANKSTSDNQSADLNDGVKDFQRGYSQIMTNQVINELLFEGGFDPVLKPEDEVIFMFAEIELDAKIKKENHVIQMFTQNAITHEEMRLLMGLDPVADEARLYFNMVTVGSTLATQQAAVDSSAQQGANNAGDNKDKPANQHGKQDSPGKPKQGKESITEKNSEKVLTTTEEVVIFTSELEVNKYYSKLEEYWKVTQEDVIARVHRGEDAKSIKTFTTRMMYSLMENQNKQYLENAVLRGFRSGREQIGIQSLAIAKKDVEEAIQRGKQSITKVVEELEMALDKLVDVEQEKRIAFVESAFHANKYRLKLIAKTMLHNSYNTGVALAAVAAKQDKVHCRCTEEACNTCLMKAGDILLDENWKENLPPHHPGCNCEVMILASNEEGN